MYILNVHEKHIKYDFLTYGGVLRFITTQEKKRDKKTVVELKSYHYHSINSKATQNGREKLGEG